MSASTNQTTAPVQAPATANADATAPTIATATAPTLADNNNTSQGFVIQPETAKLLADKLKNLPNLSYVYDDLLTVVATQKEDFMQKRLLQASIDFLNTKLCINKYKNALPTYRSMTPLHPQSEPNAP